MNGHLVRTADITRNHGLDERQQVFVANVCKGMGPEAAGEVAGYGKNVWRSVVNLPHVRAALHEAVQHSLAEDAPINLRVLRAIRDDTKAAAGVRADIAFKLLRLAGHVEPTKSVNDGPAKALSEMSAAELADWRAKNQAEIDRLTEELANRAIPVSAPSDAPEPPIVDANALDYLA